MGEGQPGRSDGRAKVDGYQLHDIWILGRDGPNLVFQTRTVALDEFGVYLDKPWTGGYDVQRCEMMVAGFSDLQLHFLLKYESHSSDIQSCCDEHSSQSN